MNTNGTTKTRAALEQKIDILSGQMAFLMEEARQQQRQRQEWRELKNDLTPIMGDIFRLSVKQLDEVEQHVQIEDILHLFKRLLRNTHNLEQLLDQMESLVELGQDISPLTRDAFISLMMRLDEFERKGYFTFLQGGLGILDRIVAAFTEKDIEQLGDNIVLILNTVKEMTQPEIMRVMQRTAHSALEGEVPEDVSLFRILRQMNDPAVKRGLAKTLNILKSVSDPVE